MRNVSYWAQSTMTRRRWLQATLSAGAGAAGLAVLGCGKNNSGPTAQSSPFTFGTEIAGISDYPNYTAVTNAADYIRRYNWRNLPKANLPPKKGGNYRFQMGLIPPHFDPFGPLVNSYVMPTNLRMIYNQLTRIKMEWTDNLDLQIPEPELASAWEQLDGGLTLVFHLRDGVRFQATAPVNGRALTSADVKYSFTSYQQTPIASYFDTIASIETPDTKTIRIKFNTPAAYFLNLISAPTTSILPPELDAKARSEQPVGTGPFQLQGGGYLKEGQEVKYVRNPNYWEVRDNVQLPYFDSVDMINITDATVALEGFRTRQLDSSFSTNNFALVDNILKSNPDTKVQILVDAPSIQYHLGLNQKNTRWADVRLRRAISLAINRQQIIDLQHAGAATPASIVDWAFMGFTRPPQLSESSDYIKNYDPTQAKALLKAAGQENLSFSLLYTGSTGNDNFISLIKDQLGQAGIQFTPDRRDSTTVTSLQFGGTVPDAIMTSQFPPATDPDTTTYQFVHSKGTSNFYNIRDTDLDALSIKPRTILDFQARASALKDVWLKMMDLVYVVPMTTPSRPFAIQPWVNNCQNNRNLDASGWGTHLAARMWYSSGAPSDRF